MQKHLRNYAENGVDIYIQNDGIVKSAKIEYDGLLAQSGACDVIAHVGYVDETSTGERFWKSVQDVKMKKDSEKAFSTTIPVDRQEGILGVSFKDGAANWDNNRGSDYMVNIM